MNARPEWVAFANIVRDQVAHDTQVWRTLAPTQTDNRIWDKLATIVIGHVHRGDPGGRSSSLLGHDRRDLRDLAVSTRRSSVQDAKRLGRRMGLGKHD